MTSQISRSKKPNMNILHEPSINPLCADDKSLEGFMKENVNTFFPSEKLFKGKALWSKFANLESINAFFTKTSGKL